MFNKEVNNLLLDLPRNLKKIASLIARHILLSIIFSRNILAKIVFT